MRNCSNSFLKISCFLPLKIGPNESCPNIALHYIHEILWFILHYCFNTGHMKPNDRQRYVRVSTYMMWVSPKIKKCSEYTINLRARHRSRSMAQLYGGQWTIIGNTKWLQILLRWLTGVSLDSHMHGYETFETKIKDFHFGKRVNLKYEFAIFHKKNPLAILLWMASATSKTTKTSNIIF